MEDISAKREVKNEDIDTPTILFNNGPSWRYIQGFSGKI